MKFNLNRKTKLFLSFLISFVLIYLLFNNIDWQLFIDEIKKADSLLLSLYALLFVASYYLRAIRWKFMLPPKRRENLKLKDLFDPIVIGFLGSYILPLRAGELMRPLALSKYTDVKFATGLASVVNERVFDILAMLAILVLSLPFIETTHPLILLAVKMLSIFSALVLSFMLFAYIKPKLLLVITDKAFSLFLPELLKERLTQYVEDFVDGLKAISGFKDLSIVIFFSFLIWFEVSLAYYLALVAFDINAPVLLGILVMLMIAFAVAVPSAPGFIGTYQFGCVVALCTMASYSKEFAIAYSIITHSIQYILVILLGVLTLRSRGMKFSEF